jgi:hypothetical protein
MYDDDGQQQCQVKGSRREQGRWHGGRWVVGTVLEDDMLISPSTFGGGWAAELGEAWPTFRCVCFSTTLFSLNIKHTMHSFEKKMIPACGLHKHHDT